jgi:raffinose/stachyose/melibiose transport system permease protein
MTPNGFRRFASDGRLTTVLLFLPPALLMFTFFVTLPLFDAASYAGYNWSGYGEPEEWVGGRNFEQMIGHNVFQQSMLNTLKIIAASLIVQIPLAMTLALLIARKTWSNNVFRLIFFMPFIMAEVATGLMWSFFFDGDYGVTAMVGRTLAMDPIYPLSDRTWAMPVILFVIVWKYFGFHMMIFIAALQNIPEDLTEAAQIDGATPFQIARRIKIPLLKPAIAVSIFFSVIGSLQLFDLIVPMTGGGPSNSTHTIVSYLYTFGLVRLKVGFGSAVGIVLFAICVAFALIYQRTIMKPEAS